MFSFFDKILRQIFRILGEFFGFFISYRGELDEAVTPAAPAPGATEDSDDDEQSDQNLTTTSSASAATLLALDKVLDKILVHVTVETLKICRLVSSIWSTAATTEIHMRENTLLEFHQDNIRPRFWLHTRDGKKRSLKDLISILEDEKEEEENFHLFCKTFAFHGNLGVHETRHFFSVYGPRIKKLVVVNLINYFTRWSTLSKILEEDAPNIQELTILGNNFDFDVISIKDDIDFMIVQLPKLTLFRLNYETSASTLYKILVGGENLQRVENFDWTHIDMFFKSDEKKMVKKLIFLCPATDQEEKPHADPNVKSVENICVIQEKNLYMTLLMSNPLQCHPEDRWGTAAISMELVKVLGMVQSHVEELHILPMGWLQDDRPESFPQFSKLKHIQISTFGPTHPIQIFPEHIIDHLDLTFPVLDSLALNFDNWDAQFWNNSWPEEKELVFQAIRKLTILNLDCQSLAKATFILEQLKKMFPKVTSLKFGGPLDTPEVINSVCRIWEEARLEELEFDFFFLTQNPGFELDAILTGIDTKECANLAQSFAAGQDPDTVQVEDVLQYLGSGQPTIRSMTDLRNLKMAFKQARRNVIALSPVSVISYRYAFNLMPDLKVTIVTT